jgi:quercetin dioxygenase-like cupin family protein
MLPPMLNLAKTPRVRVLAPIAAALLIAGAAGGWALAKSSSAPTATRYALAQAQHVRGAPGRTLGLSRVVIPGHAKLPLHYHQGTQTAYIKKGGYLVYKVHSGSVRVRKGLADQNPRIVRKISAGHKGKLKPGDWIVEQPSDHHSVVNPTNKRVVVYSATLLKAGAPPATLLGKHAQR